VTEDRYVELILLAVAAVRDLLQWWLGVSFGVLALAHFAAKKLNWAIVAAVVVLYSAHTFNTVEGLLRVNSVTTGGYEALQRLAATESLSPMAEGLLEHQPGLLGASMAAFALFGTYMACLGYLFFSFVRATRNTAS